MVVAAEKKKPSRFGPRGLVVSVVVFAVALVTIAKTLAAFATIIERYLAVHYDWRLEIGMVMGQIAFQWVFMFRRPRDEKLSYAWILVCISGLGAVLLWPLLVFGKGLAPLHAVAYFFAVVGVMFVAHWGLVSRHALPKWLCATWVLYRLLLLTFLVRWT